MSGAEAKRGTDNTGDQCRQVSIEQLAIVDRYEIFVEYIYPILLRVPRCHHVFRDRFIGHVIDQAGLFIERTEGKPSRLGLG